MALAPMLAAALAVNEAFLFVSGHAAVAGRRPVGLSLWNPAPACDWLADAGTEPALSLLPSRLWLIGLGHLGQAYLWALGLLPFARPQDLSLVLQDIDIITPSTESTSILTDATLINVKKTRAMAAWAERRGFTTAIHERLFDASFRRQDDEPAVALCGLDNGIGRQALDQVGFDFVVEAGLGRGHRDFRAIRLHTLPASRPAAQIWRGAQAKTIRSMTVPHTRACSRAACWIAAASRCSPARPWARPSSAPRPQRSPSAKCYGSCMAAPCTN